MKKTLLIITLLSFLSAKSQLTLIPDINFEIQLMTLGIDTGSFTNGSVPTSFVTSVTHLNIPNKGITSLTGIEDFTALEYLDCSLNSLDSIDVSNNIALKYLWMHDNGMIDSTIDLSNNINLTHLSLGSNNLKTLDITNNTKLKVMFTIFNYLDSIDASNNKELDTLEIAFNRLQYVKLYDSSNFTRLDLGDGNNNISGDLDLSTDTNLIYLNIASNSFSNVILAKGYNNKITTLTAGANPFLTCIEVDDTTYSQTWWTGTFFSFDPVTKFSLNCGGCHAKFHPTQLTAGGVYLVDSTHGRDLKYTWYFGDGDSSVSYLPTHNYTASGSYNVCLSIEDTVSGCSDYFCDTITVDSTGILRNAWTLTVVKSNPQLNIHENKLDNFKIYPNPTNGFITVDSDGEGYYSMFSLDGKKIIKNVMLNSQLTKIDLTGLKKGVYLLQITNNEGQKITKRLIKSN